MDVSTSSYNTTNLTFMDTNTHFTNIQISSFVVYGILLCIGATGNFVIVLRVVLDRKLRSPTFIAISGLAAADFIFLCCRIPFEILHITESNWIYGRALCKISYFIFQTASYLAGYHLVFLAFIRYYLLVHPFSSAVHLTNTKSCITTGIIWGLTTLLVLPVIITSDVDTFEFSGVLYQICTINPADKHSHVVFVVSFMVFSYFLPLLLIITLHVVKARAVARASRSLADDKKRQLYAMVVLVIVLFAVLLLPVHIKNLVTVFGVVRVTPAVQTVDLLFRAMAYSNSCVNPLVYGFMSDPFRMSLKRMCGLAEPTRTPRTSVFSLRDTSSEGRISRLESA